MVNFICCLYVHVLFCCFLLDKPISDSRFIFEIFLAHEIEYCGHFCFKVHRRDEVSGAPCYTKEATKLKSEGRKSLNHLKGLGIWTTCPRFLFLDLTLSLLFNCDSTDLEKN